jgi:flagellar FliL protein
MAEDKKAKKEDKPKEDKGKDGKGDDKSLKAEKKDAGGKDGAEGKEGEGAENAEAPQPRFTRKKIILIAGVSVLLIIAGGAGAYFSGMLDKFLPHKQPSCESVKEGDKDYATCQALQSDKDAGTPGVFTDIPPMIVNLNSSTKQPRFLKISLKVELENPEEQKKLEAVLPRVVDQFQMYLRELRIEDLRGTSGIYRMKIELLSRIRAAAPNIKIRDVLFQEILVQ